VIPPDFVLMMSNRCTKRAWESSARRGSRPPGSLFRLRFQFVEPGFAFSTSFSRWFGSATRSFSSRGIVDHVKSCSVSNSGQ